MINPFVDDPQRESTDEALVAKALKGNRRDLEELVKRHQHWIYNISLRMVFNPQDAEDVTQEVLVKIITKLSTFKGKSSFRTWIYRIVANHVINMKRKNAEKHFVSFTDYGRGIRNTPDLDLPDRKTMPVDQSIIVEETRLHCMIAMLICLKRKQRLTFILGEIFSVTDAVGSEILEISKASYRQRLSRARKQVYEFMKEICGLVKIDNHCHCDRKTGALLDNGSINPSALLFNRDQLSEVKAVSKTKCRRLDNLLDSRCRSLFRDHPFQKSPDFVEELQEILHSTEFRDILDFGIEIDH